MPQDSASEHSFFSLIEHKVVKPIDVFSDWTGRLIAWLTLAMALAMGLVVVLRYGFGVNLIAMQESVIYMHSMVFLLGAAYTLKEDGHVRVDIFYRRFSPVQKAWVNSLGSIVLLLPICGFLLFISWNFVGTSWRIGEISTEAGGIPALFLLKSLIPLAALTLALQGLAEVLRSLVCLMSTAAGESDSERGQGNRD